MSGSNITLSLFLPSGRWERRAAQQTVPCFFLQGFQGQPGFPGPPVSEDTKQLCLM